MKEILKKVTLSSPSSRTRLFEVMRYKIQKEYTGTEPIEKIEEYAILYVEVEYLWYKLIILYFFFVKLFYSYV